MAGPPYRFNPSPHERARLQSEAKSFLERGRGVDEAKQMLIQSGLDPRSADRLLAQLVGDRAGGVRAAGTRDLVLGIAIAALGGGAAAWAFRLPSTRLTAIFCIVAVAGVVMLARGLDRMIRGGRAQ